MYSEDIRPNIDKVFQTIKRKDFLPVDLQNQADIDAPIPIGFGQTNSQPSTVRMMLEWLDPQPGDKILDVGSGSGWTTAMLASLVGPKGLVYAVEKIPELVEFGRDNCLRAGVGNVRFYQAGKEFGLPRFAPYDRILVSASADRIPDKIKAQLKIRGTMVIPVRNSVLVIIRTGSEAFETTENIGFVFVPLVN